MLSRNSYPKNVIYKYICKFFNRKCAIKPLLSKKDPTPKKVFICLLCFIIANLGALSLQICNELKAFLCKHTDDKASVYIIGTLSKIGENFCFKDWQPLLVKSGIVYMLKCSCESTVDFWIIVQWFLWIFQCSINQWMVSMRKHQILTMILNLVPYDF